MKIINENVDLNSLIIEAKKSLDKYGFYIAKNFRDYGIQCRSIEISPYSDLAEMLNRY